MWRSSAAPLQAASPEDKPATKEVLELRAELLGKVGGWGGWPARRAVSPRLPSTCVCAWAGSMGRVAARALSIRVTSALRAPPPRLQLGWRHCERLVRRRIAAAFPPAYPLF